MGSADDAVRAGPRTAGWVDDDDAAVGDEATHDLADGVLSHADDVGDVGLRTGRVRGQMRQHEGTGRGPGRTVAAAVGDGGADLLQVGAHSGVGRSPLAGAADYCGPIGPELDEPA